MTTGQLGTSHKVLIFLLSETNLWRFSETCPCVHSVLGGDIIIYLVTKTRKLKIILHLFSPIIPFPRYVTVYEIQFALQSVLSLLTSWVKACLDPA